MSSVSRQLLVAKLRELHQSKHAAERIYAEDEAERNGIALSELDPPRPEPQRSPLRQHDRVVVDTLNPKRILGRIEAEYTPHQSRRECARRLRQIDKGMMSITGK